MTMKLYIGNLPESATEGDLLKKFARYGNVLSVAIERDAESGRSKRFGVIEMENEAGAQTAASRLNMTQYDDMVISVNKVRIRLGR